MSSCSYLQLKNLPSICSNPRIQWAWTWSKLCWRMIVMFLTSSKPFQLVSPPSKTLIHNPKLLLQIKRMSRQTSWRSLSMICVWTKTKSMQDQPTWASSRTGSWRNLDSPVEVELLTNPDWALPIITATWIANPTTLSSCSDSIPVIRDNYSVCSTTTLWWTWFSMRSQIHSASSKFPFTIWTRSMCSPKRPSVMVWAVTSCVSSS